MSRKVLYILLFVLSLVLLTGCGQEPLPLKADAESSLIPEEPYEEPHIAFSDDIHISELMTKNTATLTVNGTFPDWVEIENRGDTPVMLGSYALSDGAHSSPLPEITLESGQLLLLCSGEGEGCLSFSLSPSDTLSLLSPGGACLESVCCKGAEKNQILVFSGDGCGRICLYPTPGYPNDDSGHAAFMKSLTPP